MKSFIKSFLASLIFFLSCLGDLFTFHQASFLNKIKYHLIKLCGVKLNYPVFMDVGFRFYAPKNITIGKNCSFGHYNKIWAFNKVVIGDYVQTALGLTIVSGGHDTSSYASLLNGQEVILEGENWIGANVTILGGVTIGKGSIIGAGAVVTKSIPAYSIAVGVPAKVVKARVPAKLIENPFGYYTPSYHLPEAQELL